MQSLDSLNGYTRQQVLNALQASRATRTLKARFELLDENNVLIRQLDNVTSCSIQHDSLVDVKRTARVVVRDNGDINFLKHRIKPYWRLEIPYAPTPGQLPPSASYEEALGRVRNVLARWKMDDYSGSVLVDSVGDNDFSLSDVTLNQPGLVDDSGRSSRVSSNGQMFRTDDEFLDDLSSFTILGWFKSETIGEAGTLIRTTTGKVWSEYQGNTWDDLTTWGSTAGAADDGLWSALGSGTWGDIDTELWSEQLPEAGAVEVRLDGANDNIVADLTISGQLLHVETPPNTATSDRTFFAMTWRTGGALSIYLNGVLAAQSPPTQAVIGALLGVRTFALGGSGFAGLLDDWLVSTEVVSAPVLADMYQAGVRAGGEAPRDPFVEWPQGVFLPESPDLTTDENGVASFAMDCYDQCVVVQSQAVDTDYYVAAGETYTAAILELLGNTDGLVSYTVVPSTKTLPAQRMWDAGTSHLQIINDLADAINYSHMFFDENGVGVIRPYVPPQERTPEYAYEPSDISVMFREAARALDIYEIPNKWVVRVSEPDRPVLTATYINADPSNPTSTVNRGRTIAHVETISDAADQTVLDDKVVQMAQEAAQSAEEVNFSTAIMPFHSHMDLLRVAYPELRVEGEFIETAWSYDMTAGTKMTHAARRVIQLDDYIPPEIPPDEEEPPPDPTKSGSVSSVNNTCPNVDLDTNEAGYGVLGGETVGVGSRITITDHIQAEHAFQINPGGATSEPAGYAPQQTGINAGEKWTFSFDFKADGTNASAYVAADYYTSGGTYVSTEFGPASPLIPGEWKRVSQTFTIPSGVGSGGRANVTFYSELESATSKLYVTLGDYVEGLVVVPDPGPTGALTLNGRQFARSGERFFWVADTIWSGFVNLTREEWISYLDTRVSQGFNTVQVAAVFPKAGGPGPNRYGAFPYSGSLNNRSDTYWQHVDYVVQAALERNVLIAIAPVWAEGQVNTLLTTANARAFGQFIGGRYKAKDNVVWVLGGDAPASGAENVWRELAAGIRDSGDTHVMTYLPGNDQTSTTWYGGTDALLGFHMSHGDQAQAFATHQTALASAYSSGNAKPFVEGSSVYEDHPINFVVANGYTTDLDVRRDAYWAAMGGAAGITYGHHSVWQVYKSGAGVNNPTTLYPAALTDTGALDMQWLKALLLSRPRCEPASGIVTVPGSGSTWTPTMKDAAPTTLIAYIPNGTARTVNVGLLPGANAKPWWFNPRTGVVTGLTVVAASGTQTFTPPTSEDWVLVVDDTAIGYGDPGTGGDPEPPPPDPDPGGTLHGPRALAAGWVAGLVDKDDFLGTSIDSSRWDSYGPGPGHAGRGERNPSQNKIIADPGATGGRCLQIFGTTNGKTGGMAMSTSLEYGRWGVRMRGNSNDARYHLLALTWPDTEDWPEDGEIDAVEGNCGAGGMSVFLHFGNGTQNGAQTQAHYNIDSNQWHWYEWEWDLVGVRVWCDGILRFTDNNHSHSNYGTAHSLRLQLDWFPGNVNTTGTGEVRYDMVRVYTHPDTV